MKKSTKIAAVAVGATLGGLYLLGRWAMRQQPAVPAGVMGNINRGAGQVFGAAGFYGGGNPYYRGA